MAIHQRGADVHQQPDLLFDIQGAVALIPLNRPRALNAFTRSMGELWRAAYRRCDEDDAMRAVVVAGSGRAFCAAGAGMAAGGATSDTREDMTFSSNPVTPACALRTPVIAALNGHAVGLGFSLALQCDCRLAAGGESGRGRCYTGRTAKSLSTRTARSVPCP
jgi:enoyl-CoA hydratase/carnithine racemase